MKLTVLLLCFWIIKVQSMDLDRFKIKLLSKVPALKSFDYIADTVGTFLSNITHKISYDGIENIGTVDLTTSKQDNPDVNKTVSDVASAILNSIKSLNVTMNDLISTAIIGGTGLSWFRGIAYMECIAKNMELAKDVFESLGQLVGRVISNFNGTVQDLTNCFSGKDAERFSCVFKHFNFMESDGAKRGDEINSKTLTCIQKVQSLMENIKKC